MGVWADGRHESERERCTERRPFGNMFIAAMITVHHMFPALTTALPHTFPASIITMPHMFSSHRYERGKEA
jgi:hypothetical protein